MKKLIRCLTIAAGVSLLLAGSAPAATATIALDGLAPEAVAAFDTAGAAAGEKVAITSLYDGAVIPANDRYPLVEWQGPEGYADAYLLELKSAGRSLQVALKGRAWLPAGDEFAGFLGDKELQVAVFWREEGRTLKSRPVRLVVADRPLGQRVAFRAIQPVFQPMKPNAIRLLSMERRGAAPVMELDGTCVGCHAYSSEWAWFSVKKNKERQLLKMTPGPGGVDLSNQSIGEFTFLSIAPKGRYAVIVRDAVGDLTLNNSVLEPFDYYFNTADLWCYDSGTKEMVPLPGASDPNLVEDMPKISPDGQTVLFSRYKVAEENGVKSVPSMDLYEVPINGCKGGEPRAISVASAEGRHSYFGRYVPNGKWLSCTRGDGRKGIFALPSSDIYLLNRDGSTIRKMNLNQEGTMDSWHDWSPDSHWLVFSSKRDKNLMTGLYLAYVDDDGKDYPPVKLWGSDTFKVNTPVFVPDDLVFEDAVKVRAFVYKMYTTPAAAPAPPAAPAAPAPPAPPASQPGR